MLLPGVDTWFNILGARLGARNSMVIKKDMVYLQRASSKYCLNYNSVPSKVYPHLSKRIWPVSTKSFLFLFRYRRWWRQSSQTDRVLYAPHWDWCQDDSRCPRMATGIKDSSTSDQELVDRDSRLARTSGKFWWEWNELKLGHTTWKATVLSPVTSQYFLCMRSHSKPKGGARRLWHQEYFCLLCDVVWLSWEPRVLRPTCWQSFLVGKYEDRYTGNLHCFVTAVCTLYTSLWRNQLGEKKAKTNKKKGGDFQQRIGNSPETLRPPTGWRGMEQHPFPQLWLSFPQSQLDVHFRLMFYYLQNWILIGDSWRQ